MIAKAEKKESGAKPAEKVITVDTRQGKVNKEGVIVVDAGKESVEGLKIGDLIAEMIDLPHGVFKQQPTHRRFEALKEELNRRFP